MPDSYFRISHAALVAALVSSPVFAASDPAAIEQQQEIDRLRQQLAVSTSGEAVVEPIASDAQQAKLDAQDAPRSAMKSARPTISSADGRSSISLRSVVQLDAAHYAEDADGGAATDFRRGSVGAVANRETAAARDFSNGAYFRRARFGFEGTVARDFSYRCWQSSEAPAPRARRASTTSGSATPASLPSPSRSAHSRRRPIWTTASTSRARSSSSVPHPPSCRATRTVNDAEVFDSQLAAVGRFGALLATSAEYNIHAGLSGTWVFQPPIRGRMLCWASVMSCVCTIGRRFVSTARGW